MGEALGLGPSHGVSWMGWGGLWQGQGLGVAFCVRGEMREFWGHAAGLRMGRLGGAVSCLGVCLEGASGENVLAIGEGSGELCTEDRRVCWGFWGDLEGPRLRGC